MYTAFVDVHEKLPFIQPGAELSFSYCEDGAVRRVTEVHELILPDGASASSQPAASLEAAQAPAEPALSQPESMDETFPAGETADAEAEQTAAEQ